MGKISRLIGRTRRWISRSDEHFKIFVRDLLQSCIPLFVAFTLLLVLSLVMLSLYPSEPLCANPGTIFAVGVGVITLAGFWFTWRSIKSSYYISQVTVFPDLLRRLEEIIVESVKKKEGGPLKIVCFTPAIGNLSARRSFQGVNDLLNKLLEQFQKMEIEVICLQDPDPDDQAYEDDLRKLKEQAADKQGKSLVQSVLGKDVNDLANDPQARLIESLRNRSKLFEFYLSYGRIFYSRYGVKAKPRSFLNAYEEARTLINELRKRGAQFHMIASDKLPHFHLLLTAKRAIAYVPLSLYPYFFSTERWWPNLGIKNYPDLTDIADREGKDPVEIFGLETTEPNLLRKFEEYFEFCRCFLK